MVDVSQAGSAQAFALYAGIAGAAAAFGLARDARLGLTPPSRYEGLLMPLGLAALGVAFALDMAANLRLLTGALVLIGLVLMAVAPRRTDRRSAGRRVGAFFTWAGIAVALISAFIHRPLPPDLPV